MTIIATRRMRRRSCDVISYHHLFDRHRKLSIKKRTIQYVSLLPRLLANDSYFENIDFINLWYSIQIIMKVETKQLIILTNVQLLQLWNFVPILHTALHSLDSARPESKSRPSWIRLLCIGECKCASVTLWCRIHSAPLWRVCVQACENVTVGYGIWCTAIYYLTLFIKRHTKIY